MAGLDILSEKQFSLLEKETKSRTCAQCGITIPRKQRAIVIMDKETRELKDVCKECRGGE